MSVLFLDGPAEGVVLELARAPVYLRAVVNAAGVWDALDFPGDGPRDSETVYAYRRQGDAGSIHLDYTESRTGRRRGRDIAYAEYRVAPEQPDAATMRDPVLWRAWCQARSVADAQRDFLENLP